ncbi:Calpain-like protease 1 [Pseudozyma hubeiensis]|nr:Calpain-like protease 1 [Pseudozyma hubeiensis]
MSAPITPAEWDLKLKNAQEQAQRATKAELARNYSEAFELYVRSGQLFVWLLGNLPSPSSQHASENRASPFASSSAAVAGCSEPAATQTRERLKQMATKVMARAEKIKAIRKDLRPIDRDALSQEEQSTILVSSSLINGCRYPVWHESQSREPVSRAATFSQQKQPHLSSIQLRKGAVYKRASQVGSEEAQGWSTSLAGSDIVQDIVSDCSFVAALEVAVQHDRIFGGQLATSALHPQDVSGRIQPSPDGQYHIKLHINGAPRMVVIDDHLPCYPSTVSTSQASSSATASFPDESDTRQHRLMCVTSRDGQLIWPALLEKAFLQVMGGYDFAGSNGSIDLYALTGWLPEHIFLRHAGFQREKTWIRFHDAWNAGRCMATAGTAKAPSRNQPNDSAQPGEAPETSVLESGLVSSHNYSILDVRTFGSRRYVKLMNPWRTATGIRPAIAIPIEEERRVYAESTFSTMSIEHKLSQVRLANDAEDDKAPSTFTVSWDDFCSHFDSLFLNWDPKLFDNSVTVHSSWRGATSHPTALGSKQPDPHFKLSLTVPASTPRGSTDYTNEIWLLLTRHFTSTQNTAADALPRSPEQGTSDYIAIHAFEDDQRSAEGAQLASTPAPPSRTTKHKGAYVDGTHCLVRLMPSFLRKVDSNEASPRADSQQESQQCSFTIVVSRRSEDGALPSSAASQTKEAGKDVNYTLAVFSRYSMELSELRTRLPYCESVSGSWTARTAGGNATLASFMTNPQYTLVVPAGAGEVQLQVMLESSDRRIPVQVLIAYPGAGTGRVTHLTEGDVVLSSGMYHHGLALCSTSRPGTSGAVVRSGSYMLVASTFAAGMQDDFHLRVESTRPVQLKPIPQEGAGMFHRRLTSSWRRGVNAHGSRANQAYFDNPSWRFTVDRPGPTDFAARIKVEPMRSDDPVRPYVHLALFAEREGGWQQVASSGSYTDLICGAAVEKVKLPPGTYRIVASTYQADVEAAFAVDVYTESKVDFGKV